MQAHTGAPAVVEQLPHDFEVRLRLLEYAFVASDHEGERGVLGPRLRTRARGIQEVNALLLEGAVDLATDGWGDGAAIGYRRSRPRAGQQSIGSERERARHITVSDAV